MPKNYLLLDFSDYVHRTTPIINLKSVFERRVVRKGGNISVYHMADMFAKLRSSLDSELSHHPVQGILDIGVIDQLLLHARGLEEWGQLFTDCVSADKIIFAAHGHKDDTNNVYCEESWTSIRCGNIEGINFFLDQILQLCEKPAITITLVVCFSARSGDHTKHHVNELLTEEDVRSSLAYKLFTPLSSGREYLRLTARTGATSASSSGTGILSQTEEAIIASETKSLEFPGTSSEDVVGQMMNAYGNFENSLDNSNLSEEQKQNIKEESYRWFSEGCDPQQLEALIDDVSELDDNAKGCGLKFLELLCCCCGMDYSWRGNAENTLDELRQAAARNNRLFRLQATSNEKFEKYGKFVYEKVDGRIVVSRWMNPEGEYQLVQLFEF